MEAAIENLFKSFTRYFMPGLIALLLAVVLPAIVLFDPASVYAQLKGLASPAVAIFGSLFLGYLMDAAGAYRYTLSYRKYLSELSDLTEELKRITLLGSNDPDIHLAHVWYHDEKSHDRIFSERAEWVLVLESAFALLLSAIVTLGVSIYRDPHVEVILSYEFAIVVGLVLLSYLISRKGVQRMKAHNQKVLVAVKHLEGSRSQLSTLEQTIGEQNGADQPATAPESKPEGKSKPKPDSERRSQ